MRPRPAPMLHHQDPWPDKSQVTFTMDIRCVDQGKSVRRASGAVDKPSFIDSAIPAGAAVFIDSSMPGDIYVNEVARNELERRIKQAGITGMIFVQVWGKPVVSATA